MSATAEKPADPTEVLEPTLESGVVTIGKEENRTLMVFEQRPLSFFGKMDFFSVMGRALDKAMGGPDGISLADLLDAPENATELRDADTFIRGVAKISGYAPEILGELYCVILSVPRGQREFAKEVMGQHESDGGLSDEVGIEILERFVDQNWEVMVAFFKERLTDLARKIGEKAAPEGRSRSSKRSKSTPRSTPSPSKS